MPKPQPLRLFIRPPYDKWELVHGFGPEQPPPSPPHEPEFYDYAVLRTSGEGTLYAAVEGKLSVVPPMISTAEDPALPVNIPTAAEPLPAAVNLYLYVSPVVVARRPDFQTQAAGIYHSFGFAYQNVETASLEAALAELLDDALIPPPAIDRSRVVEMLVRGHLDLRVTAGHPIGKAGHPIGKPSPVETEKSKPNPEDRIVGFTVLTYYGAIDPAYYYDWMRKYVDDANGDLGNLLKLMPICWPVIVPDLGSGDAVVRTKTSLYPMTVLNELKTSRKLSSAQWREVGINQKALYRKRLLKRVGQPAQSDSTEPPFEFNYLDWKNIFQLEAVVEFYANFSDPWAAGAVPRSPSDPNYVTVNFLPPAGESAQVVGQSNTVTLDGSPDLSRVSRNHDILLLENDTNPARPAHKYLIVSVNDPGSQVILDAHPALAGPNHTSRWSIISPDPVIIIIDPFGPRPGLVGNNANRCFWRTVALADVPSPDLSRVNPQFDTIYLSSDTARPSRTYRITAVNTGDHEVTLDGDPTLDSGSSAWYIQAGIGGKLPILDSNLGPGKESGFDHYEGVLFTVKDGEIICAFQWSSYTSRAQVGELRSSIRGNKVYDVTSYMSGDRYRNYCFKVTDSGATYDGVQEARFYFSTPVGDDSCQPGQEPKDGGLGKTKIRLHQGQKDKQNEGSGSAGCLVSDRFANPECSNFRDLMIRLYQENYRVLNGKYDTSIQPLMGVNHQGAQAIWDKGKISEPDWKGKLKASLWLIRPDERPLP